MYLSPFPDPLPSTGSAATVGLALFAGAGPGAEAVGYSFLVGLLHPHLSAGVSRRFPWHLFRSFRVARLASGGLRRHDLW